MRKAVSDLFLSLQAAYTAPLIMMAQNREAAKDRLMLHEDFETNCRTAEEIQQLLNILEQHGHLLEILLEERSQRPDPNAAAGEARRHTPDVARQTSGNAREPSH
jgi:uncharacterized membrane protein